MILPRGADYALRAMIHLARERGPRFVPLNEIASELGTPPFLLARLMQSLVRAQLVQSMKGHHGGFRLRHDPAAITAAAIVHAVVGPFKVQDPFDCLPLGPTGTGTLTAMFARAEAALEDILAAVTLAELARRVPVTGGHGHGNDGSRPALRPFAATNGRAPTRE
jgi:Rrf2 family protein